MEIEITMKSSRIRSLSILVESSSAAEIIMGEELLGIKKGNRFKGRSSCSGNRGVIELESKFFSYRNKNNVSKNTEPQRREKGEKKESQVDSK
jgi:hypothetical protein